MEIIRHAEMDLDNLDGHTNPFAVGIFLHTSHMRLKRKDTLALGRR